MERQLIIGVVALAVIGAVALTVPDAAAALAVVLIPSLIALGLFRHYSEDKEFITKIFIGGLLVRLAFGLFVQIFELREFFGGDANTYDQRGLMLLDQWLGNAIYLDPVTASNMAGLGSGWGMYYLVASLYAIVGRNILAAQSLCAVFGAAIAPLVYFCAHRLFQNERVAKTSAFLAAFFPAFIIWSGQLLKDGLIVFFLVLAMTMVLSLQEKFKYGSLIVLFVSIGAILTLRFYIFYMLGIAVVGSFIVGFSKSGQALARNTAVLVMLGLAMTYFGITRNATVNFEKYGSLERVQGSRGDLVRSAKSGFGEDIDVSTTSGAISAIPVGFVYLMFAPFPWEVSTLRASIPLPEVLVWWAMMPLLVYGLWFTIKTRLRAAFPILIFSLMLTLAYSIFQGNVGTAYRQRTQIQVFLFMFIAVGWQLYQEKKEDKKLLARARQRRLEHALQARLRS